MEAAKRLFAILIGTMIFAGQVSAQSFLTNGLVAYYPLNGNANDESGYGNDLTNYGATPCPDRFGHPDGAYLFNGANCLESTAPPPLNEVENWTIAAWIDPTSFSQSVAFAVCAGINNGGPEDGFGMGISGGDQLWAFFPGVDFFLGADDFSFTEAWYDVVMSCSSGRTTFFVNGDPLMNSAPILATPGLPTAMQIGSAGIGYNTSAVRAGFIGAIDDVRVYSRALSPIEIKELNYIDLGGSLPLILSQPTNLTTAIGSDATFGVMAFEQTNSPPLTCLWTFDGTNIPGATNADLILTNVQPSQAGAYSVIVSNNFGSVTSSNALLTVVTSPIIVTEPQSQRSSIGGSAMFSAQVIGATPLFFQWKLNGIEVDHATNSTLLLTNVALAQAGNYNIAVSNRYGTTTSSNALLSVLTIPGNLTNGLVAYYPFRGNANDESGYGNDLTNYGATLCADRFGASNQAYYFNGQSYLGSTVSPLTQVSNWTVTAWIEPTVLLQSNGYAVCVGYDNESSGDGFAMGISGGSGPTATANDGEPGNQLWAFFPGHAFAFGGADFPSTNEWYQVVMTRDTDTTIMYLNGDQGTNSSPILLVPNQPTSLEVGSGGNGRYFIGAVDDVRVYNRVLLASEVAELYNDDQGGPLFPAIASQPTNEIVSLGGRAAFAVGSGASVLVTYQWSFNEANIRNATNSSLFLTNVQTAQDGLYSVVISNVFGAVTSSPALLTVAVSPAITGQPVSQVFSVGDSATFYVTAVGAPPLTYQWRMNGDDISRATNSSLPLKNIQTNQTGSYSVVVKNKYGSIISSNAILDVDIPPTIDVSPQSELILPGGNATLSVTASGLPLTYQWVWNDVLLAGQTGATLVITNFSALNDGQYAVIVSNAVGVVTTSPAPLTFQSGAAFLDPRAFLSLGVFDPASDVVIDASTWLMSGGSTFVGVPFTNAGFGMYVFTFSGFTLQSNVDLIVTNCGSGTPGIALLSQSDAIIDGVVDASASAASASSCGLGAGGSGVGGEFVTVSGGGGGGGFGGNGGNGGGGGGIGGAAFDPDITAQLADGSCGGPSGEGLDFSPAAFAGDGGGAIEIAAVGLLAVSGAVLANGANGGDGYVGCGNAIGGGGGGSGGAILVRGSSVTVNSGAVLSAMGGNGGAGAGPVFACSLSAPGGGGGGGGRIVVDYVSAGTNDGFIMALGGGADGTIFFGQNPMVLPFPTVAVFRSAPEKVVLSWPATATNYTLQFSPALGPAADWTAAPTGIEIGENIVLTNQTSDAAAFFRLKHN
jgi:hypothetical protein